MMEQGGGGVAGGKGTVGVKLLRGVAVRRRAERRNTNKSVLKKTQTRLALELERPASARPVLLDCCQ